MDTDSSQPNDINKINEFSDLEQPLSETESTQNIVAESPTEDPAVAPSSEPLVQPRPQTVAAATEPKTPKKKKSLIVTIFILIFILICGGGFAAFAIIKNQPDNVALSAIHKLFSSKNIAVNGSADISLPSIVSAYIGVKSIHYNISTETSGANNSTKVAVNVNLTDGTAITLPEIGELMLDNGIFYLKVDNLKNVYDSYRDQLSYYLTSILEGAYEDSAMTKCKQKANTSEETYKCYDVSASISSADGLAAAQSMIDLVLTTVDDIVNYADGKWFEISVEDILNDDLMSWIGGSDRDAILEAYNCAVDKFDNFDQYSNELSSLYDKYPFVSVTPIENSFYNISLKGNELAGYLNSVPGTRLFNEFSSCFDNPATIASSDFNVQAEQLEPIIKSLPNISAKIEGFLDHQLTELKINKKDTYFNFDSDLNFSYSGNINFSAPDTSTPIMELVHKIYGLVNSVQSKINNMFYDNDDSETPVIYTI